MNFDIESLINSPSFCIAPWIHLHTWPNGNVYSCCMTPFTEPIGNLEADPLKNIWNNSTMKQLRLQLLNNEYPKQCKQCHEIDQTSNHSLRKHLNRTFHEKFAILDNTLPDGTYENFNLSFWDFRFSNVCNLKCRTCGPGLSTSWFDDDRKLYTNSVRPKIFHTEKLWEQIYPHISQLEEIYFAGGEPLLMEEHYDILNKLIQLKKFDVRLSYNTNFTILNYKNMNLFDLWSHFKHVKVDASIDAEGDRGEYIRSGSSWEKIVENRKLMIKEAPKVDFYLCATLSVLNALVLPDLHKNWISNKLVAPNKININYILQPEYYRAQILTDKLKSQLVLKYTKHIEYLNSFPTPPTHAILSFKNAIDFIMKPLPTDLRKKFCKMTISLDKIRRENFYSIFPELHELFEGTDG